MTATTDAVATDDLTAEVTSWLEEHWDPDLTVEEWWDRLGRSGWAVPTWPVEWYGKGLSRAEGVRVMQTIGTFGALGAPGGLGTLLAGPTIIVHGTEEQKRRYLRKILAAEELWCQLYSEPGAGSDLASLRARKQDGSRGFEAVALQVHTSWTGPSALCVQSNLRRKLQRRGWLRTNR